MKNERKRIDNLVCKIAESYKNESYHRIDSSEMPSLNDVVKIIEQIKQILFPGYFAEPGINKQNVRYFVGETLCELKFSLTEQISKAFIAAKDNNTNAKESESIALNLLESLPDLRNMLKKDIKAAMDGDPAAKYIPEVIICYPCIEVILVYRIANKLYKAGVPLIPRMMSEYLHAKKGVDIHPGASIGEYFFIDHATGVVIGETTIIGNNVKIYQGVTLGALSFPKDKSGKIIKGLKRHPTIEDSVTIYANATILGGDTIIGKGAVIGGNAWIVESVEPNSKVKK